ncbi:MAG TPA: iron-sulfur cluster-binding domain-containing protein, partial [Polyangiales bacterium]
LTLLYGNRGEQDIIFRKQLDALCAAHPSLRLRHVLSEAGAASDAVSGILDEATVSAQLRQLAAEPGDFDAYLLCGPEPMMQAARRALLAHGVPEAKIHEERFTTSSAPSDPVSGDSELCFVHEGETQVVTVDAGETLLETTQRLNLPLDFSCMAGQCGTCMIKLDAGQVEMEEPNILTDAQKKRGLILACVSRPRGACTVSTLPPGR